MRKRHSGTPGQSPGTLNYTGVQSDFNTRITVIDYNESSFTEKKNISVEECSVFNNVDSVSWLDVDGINQIETIEKIGNHFGLHPILMEDIVNTEQRPKLDDFGNTIFLVIKMLSYNHKLQKIESEHVSMVMGKGYVITFQDIKEGDVFNPVRERLRNNKGRIRKLKSDYLLYALIDVIVDNYFKILEGMGDRIEELENEVISNPSTATLRQIYKLKREIMYLRKCVWPIREVINGLNRTESELICDSTNIYFRDVYDHTIQIIDAIEYYRDMLAGMLDIYLSSLSYRMNAVMKVLTIIATIFIPLTFITSIYGMNFEYMPELKTRYGYYCVWLVMISASCFMLYFFKKKKWF